MDSPLELHEPMSPIERFGAWYRAKYGCAPDVRRDGAWYYVNGDGPFRKNAFFALMREERPGNQYYM